MAIRRHLARALVVLVGTIIVVAVTSPPVGAGADPDLSAIVLRDIPGYQVVPGASLSGPLAPDQIADIAPDAEGAARLSHVLTASYGRTFETPEGRRVAIIGLDLGTAATARSFQAGAREAAPDLGPVSPIADVGNGFRIEVRPERLPNTSAQEIFVQSGRLVFVLIVTDQPTSPVSVADATDLAQAQAAAVPAAVAAESPSGDEDQDPDSDSGGATGIAHAVGYAVGLVLPVAVIAAVVVLARRRRRR